MKTLSHARSAVEKLEVYKEIGSISTTAIEEKRLKEDVRWKIDSFIEQSRLMDKNGNIISWTYDVPIEHETFMIYEDGEPYCRGFVFRV